MKKVILTIALAFGLGLNAQSNEPMYTSEQLDLFIDLGSFNDIYEDIIKEFVYDTNKYLGIELNSDDLFVMDFDYKMLGEVWGEDLSNVLGMALGMYNNEKVVVILNQEAMEDKNYYELKSTIYHELMHDVFNYEHHEEKDMLMSSHASRYDGVKEYVEWAIIEAFDKVYWGQHQNHDHKE